ncbi:SUMF1/EgtB/PvdO family nonheme iron enzyme [Ruegeria hyattellae]|uniref:SUMF1/EgtB/PvdO family nonheme iron enzyme n=1 Tax=Ruegeria hyattellae TaxID=3233337 RepID=UPI00355BDABC
MIGRILALAWLAATPAMAQTTPQSTPETGGWEIELYDPGAGQAPADLLLPMPCGGSMAFQKVVVPLDAADPLADRRVRLGQSSERAGYSDYLRTAFLRGPFSDDPSSTHYYISRYELTQGQFRALQGDCSDGGRADRIARGGFSWFDAVTLAQNYTAWLYRNAPDSLPRSGDASGFLRLPTEAEWEYATRGGAKADPSAFSDPRYFTDSDPREHAFYQGGGARGRLGPVGLRKPNPLGLYDVYGNAEELMLEPYRMNAAGRAHGQVGGVVTRGGSVLSSAGDLYSAQRTEYPPHDTRTGRPLRGETFGLRLVIGAHVSTSQARLGEIEDSWRALAAEGDDAQGDPDRTLSDLIRAEPDTKRQQELDALQLELRQNRDRIQTALDQSARAALLSGAVFVEALRDSAAQIDAKAASIRMLVELQRTGGGSGLMERQLRGHVEEIKQMRRQRQFYLLSYQTALDTLATDYAPDETERLRMVLEQDLTQAGQTRLAGALDRFSDDLGVYAQTPDMSQQALMNLALN